MHDLYRVVDVAQVRKSETFQPSQHCDQTELLQGGFLKAQCQFPLYFLTFNLMTYSRTALIPHRKWRIRDQKRKEPTYCAGNGLCIKSDKTRHQNTNSEAAGVIILVINQH